MSSQFSQFVPPPLSALPSYAGVLIQERVKNAANAGARAAAATLWGCPARVWRSAA